MPALCSLGLDGRVHKSSFAFFLRGAERGWLAGKRAEPKMHEGGALCAKGTVCNWAELCVSCFLLCGI